MLDCRCCLGCVEGEEGEDVGIGERGFGGGCHCRSGWRVGMVISWCSEGCRRVVIQELGEAVLVDAEALFR